MRHVQPLLVYATVDEMALTFLAVFSSTLVLVALFSTGLLYQYWHAPPDQLPRSIPLLDGLLVLLAVGSTRFSVRMAYRPPSAAEAVDARRVLIVGAGVVGQMTVKELRANPAAGLRPVGFIDDDPRKQHLHIVNLPVLGGREDLPQVVRDYEIDQVVIAIASASGKTIREFLQLCEAAGVPARTVPSVSAILETRSG